MVRKQKFSKKILKAIDKRNSIYVRAGTEPHRFVRIWAVVVEDRVFARSWSLKPRSWYRTLLVEPTGAIEVDGKKIAIRSSQLRSKQLQGLVDRAYLEKYSTKASIRYAKDLCRAKSRSTTTEFKPV